MNAQQLLKSAHNDASPPQPLSLELQALWLQQAGDWDASHELCNEIPDPAGAWIHAYLHRVEGDLGNAGYWYHRAGKEMPDSSLQQEWLEIATALR
ncbi:hypothetical protein [Rubritalea marina]|uniref:hypothetical protein n=1 Tax=Rubritalea marina TaxID=361055 RepID=UPI00036CF003|nr:hypothetical protein [Rubritalea marina]